MTFGGTVSMHWHEDRLSDIPRSAKVAVFLRDPIARFVSGANERIRLGEGAHATAEEWALRIETTVRYSALLPMATWLDDDLGRLDFIGRTETLAQDYERLTRCIGIERPAPLEYRNRAPTKAAPLSPEAIATLRHYYAADYALLEQLCGTSQPVSTARP